MPMNQHSNWDAYPGKEVRKMDEVKQKQTFKHMQQLGDLWVDPADLEKEKKNDKIMFRGVGVGALLFAGCALGGHVVLGVALFLLSCLAAAGFME
jgi:hypothetical protein